ncbi:MAG: bifunctional DNA-formamidopyrimidine glycosylase/DNA-(apurinic or apyrimidinic site) lyase [Caulobacteraceae bacterium]
MPELPEVETVRKGLEAPLVGARLARVDLRRPDLRFALPAAFSSRLTGARILALERRGKYIIGRLDSGEALLIHLGMTGRFTIEGPAADARPTSARSAAPARASHAHIVFETDAGDVVTYFDARRFGSMDLFSARGLEEALSKLGPEPLGAGFTADHLRRAFQGRRAGVKALLLDQAIVAGLGNIYACESLHRAGISPLASAGRLPRRKLERLVLAIREVLAEAIAAGGSTLRDYAAADGSLGYFQHRFRVYGREGEECPRVECPGLVRRAVQAGRASFYCPGCQR